MRILLISILATLLFVSCKKKKAVEYSIGIVKLNMSGFETSGFSGYTSKFVCFKYIELRDDSCIIYENEENKSKRLVKRNIINAKDKNRIVDIIENIFEKPSRGSYLDSTIYCGLRCNDALPYVATKKLDKIELIAHQLHTISIEDGLYLDSFISVRGGNIKHLNNSEFLFGVLRNEQYANINIYSPPAPPPYTGKKIKFIPPKEIK